VKNGLRVIIKIVLHENVKYRLVKNVSTAEFVVSFFFIVGKNP